LDAKEGVLLIVRAAKKLYARGCSDAPGGSFNGLTFFMVPPHVVCAEEIITMKVTLGSGGDKICMGKRQDI
jgi:hypothetical protein